MGRIKDLVTELAENYQKEHPEISWEEAMNYACFAMGGDHNEKID